MSAAGVLAMMMAFVGADVCGQQFARDDCLFMTDRVAIYQQAGKTITCRETRSGPQLEKLLENDLPSRLYARYRRQLLDSTIVDVGLLRRYCYISAVIARRAISRECPEAVQQLASDSEQLAREIGRLRPQAQREWLNCGIYAGQIPTTILASFRLGGKDIPVTGHEDEVRLCFQCCDWVSLRDRPRLDQHQEYRLHNYYWMIDQIYGCHGLFGERLPPEQTAARSLFRSHLMRYLELQVADADADTQDAAMLAALAVHLTPDVKRLPEQLLQQVPVAADVAWELTDVSATTPVTVEVMSRSLVCAQWDKAGRDAAMIRHADRLDELGGRVDARLDAIYLSGDPDDTEFAFGALFRIDANSWRRMRNKSQHRDGADPAGGERLPPPLKKVTR